MRIDARVLPRFATAAILLVVVVAGCVIDPRFASVGVARDLLVDQSFLAIAAIGATFVILLGGIDLSVGSVVALSSVISVVMVERAGVHPIAAFAGAVALSTAFGALQGALIHAFAMPAFMVTLAGLFAARGAAFLVSGQSVGVRSEFITQTLCRDMTLHLPGFLGGVALPLGVLMVLTTLACAVYVLGYAPLGRRIYAVGDDERSARLMGVPVGATRILVYAIAGACSGLAGVALVLYQQSGNPASCRGFELDVIAAVVIGGTLLRGGVGSIWGTVMGVLILGVIQTLISMDGRLSSWWARIAIGALLLMFVTLQRAIGAGRRD